MLLRAVSPDALNRALCDGSDWEAPAEGFNSIPEALADLANGKFVVVLDDESRENEGDLIMAAETMTTEAMAFMVEYTSGVICVPLEGRWGFDHVIIARCTVSFLLARVPSLYLFMMVLTTGLLYGQGFGQATNTSYGQFSRKRRDALHSFHSHG